MSSALGSADVVAIRKDGASISNTVSMELSAAPSAVIGLTSLVVAEPGIAISGPRAGLKKSQNYVFGLSRSSTLHAIGQVGHVATWGVSTSGRLIDMPPSARQIISVDDSSVVSVRSDRSVLALKSGLAMLSVQWISDTCGAVLATGTVEVAVVANDHVPTVASQSLNMSEESTAMRQVALVVTDQDSQQRNDAVYIGIVSVWYLSAESNTNRSATAAEAATWFTLNASARILTVHASARFDYEVIRSVYVEIAASNYNDELATVISGGTSVQVSKGTFALYLSDVNDNSPIFSQSLYRGRLLPDGFKHGSEIAQLSATDKDSNANGKLTYAVEQAAAANGLALDAETGLVVATSNRSVTARHPVYDVAAVDGGNPAFTAQAKLNVEVYNQTYLAYIILNMPLKQFEEYKNNFCLIVGSQISQVLYLAGARKGAPLQNNATHTLRTRRREETTIVVVTNVKGIYGGLDHSHLQTELQKVDINDAYGSLTGEELAGLLAGFKFESAFGQKASDVGPYTKLMASSNDPIKPVIDVGPTVGVDHAVDSHDKSMEATWIVVIVMGMLILVVAAVIVVYARKPAEDAKTDDALVNSTHYFPSDTQGFQFSFTGGEVDPETGAAFFAGGGMGSPKAGGGVDKNNVDWAGAGPSGWTGDKDENFENPAFGASQGHFYPGNGSSQPFLATGGAATVPFSLVSGSDEHTHAKVPETTTVSRDAAAALARRHRQPAQASAEQAALFSDFEKHLQSADKFLAN